MARPRMTQVPAADELADLDPLDRARRITRLSREWSTLTPGLSALRKEALRDARKAGHLVEAIAVYVGLSHARVSQLTTGWAAAS